MDFHFQGLPPFWSRALGFKNLAFRDGIDFQILQCFFSRFSPASLGCFFLDIYGQLYGSVMDYMGLFENIFPLLFSLNISIYVSTHYTTTYVLKTWLNRLKLSSSGPLCPLENILNFPPLLKNSWKLKREKSLCKIGLAGKYFKDATSMKCKKKNVTPMYPPLP